MKAKSIKEITETEYRSSLPDGLKITGTIEVEAQLQAFVKEKGGLFSIFTETKYNHPRFFKLYNEFTLNAVDSMTDEQLGSLIRMTLNELKEYAKDTVG